MIPFPRARLACALLVCAGSLAAQDVAISPLGWRMPYDAPNELPAFKTRPAMTVPEELRKTPDVGYVIYDLLLDGSGKILALSPHATLAAYERASRGWHGQFVFAPGKRDGKGVNTASTFAVIFNPASADEKKPDATARLLEVAPVRLKSAKRMKLQEWTPDHVEWADVAVDESGKVTTIKNAPDGLARDFEIAARNWRFAPARKDGVAVASEIRTPFVIVTEDAEGMSEGKRTVPKVTRQQRPVYPFAMRASGMRGEVVVDFIVDIEGRVRNPYVVRSLNPSFDDPAIDAVRQWKFEPGRVGDRPEPTHMQVPIIFQLDETYDGGKGPMAERRRGDLSKLPEDYRYDTPPKPQGTVRVVYPYALLRAQKTGKAVVRYIVGKDGRVAGAEIGPDSTAPEFGLALRAAVECFTFEPALKAGQPCLAVEGFQQEFNRDFQWGLVSDEDVALLRREEKKPETILTLRDLDTAPAPLSRRPPRFPVAVAGKQPTGEALIEFLIDEEGRARLPRIISATDDAFGYAAVQSVASWRFEPPTRGGKPVLVRAQIPITFGGQKSDK
jgi:TonB family protein